MPALAVQYRTVGIMKFNIMMIINFTMILSFSYLPATHSLCLYRIAAFEPVNYIQVMNMLFNNMITAKPVEIIPVAHLVFHFCLVIFSLLYPYTIIVPPCLCRSNITDH